MKRHLILFLLLASIAVSTLNAQNDKLRKIGVTAGVQTTVISVSTDLEFENLYSPRPGFYLGVGYRLKIGKHQLKSAVLAEQRRMKSVRRFGIGPSSLNFIEWRITPQSAIVHYNLSFSTLYSFKIGNWSIGSGLQARYQPPPVVRFKENALLPDISKKSYTIRSLNELYLDIPIEITYAFPKYEVGIRYERSLMNRLISPNGVNEFDNTVRAGATYYF